MFNIVKFEFKQSLSSLVTWTLTLCLVSAVYITMYSVIESSLEDFKSIIESYPKQILSVVGIDVDYLTSFEGYYTFVLTFINIIAFAFASSFTFKIFIKEFKNKSIEFISTKPITRTYIVLQKTLSLVIILTVAIVIYINAMYLLVKVYSDISYISFLKLNIPTYIIVIFALVISLLTSTLFRKIRNSGSTGFITAFGFYFVYMIGTLVESKEILYLSVYGLFEYPNIDYMLVFIAFIIFVLLYIASLFINNRKDVL